MNAFTVAAIIGLVFAILTYAVLAKALPEGIGRSLVFRLAISIVSALGLSRLSYAYIEPKFQDRDLESAIDKTLNDESVAVQMTALKSHDPQKYQQFRRKLKIILVEQHENTLRESSNKVLEAVKELQGYYFARAHKNVILRQLDAQIALTTELMAVDPEAGCRLTYPQIFGSIEPKELRKFESYRSYESSLAQIIHSGANELKANDGDLGVDALSKFQPLFFQKNPDIRQAFKNAQTAKTTDEKKKLLKAHLAFLTEIRKMTDQQAAAIFRMLLTQNIPI